MHIISKIAMITINETLFIEMISFLIFLFLINRIMFKPLHATMSERDGYVREVEEEILDAGRRLDELNREIRENESEMIQEGHEQREMLKAEGEAQSEAILKQVRSEIESIHAENQKAISDQLAEARKSLVSESEKLARLIMEKVLDRRIIHV